MAHHRCPSICSEERTFQLPGIVLPQGRVWNLWAEENGGEGARPIVVAPDPLASPMPGATPVSPRLNHPPHELPRASTG